MNQNYSENTRIELFEKVKSFPESPGVYQMFDNASEKPLYIGKAIRIKNRVLSYFQEGGDGRAQIPALMEKVSRIEWIATANEAEALILEARLIRLHQPRYNLDLKDDTHYPYIKITVNEPFPRCIVTRKVDADNARYFGPYTDARAMRSMLEFARKVFKLRDCSRSLPAPKPMRSCINKEIGTCSGACAGEISQEDYRANVGHLIKFLQGRKRDIANVIKDRMEKASQEMRFEDAALLRDQHNLLSAKNRLQNVDLASDEDLDAIGLWEGGRQVCLCILSFRDGQLLEKRHFLFNRKQWEIDSDGRDGLILRYYQQPGIETPPPEVLIPDNAGFSASLIEESLELTCGHPVKIVVPQRGTRERIIAMAADNARLYGSMHLPPDDDAVLESLAKVLCLPRALCTIEAFDISNLGSSHAVAGMVRFVNGLPDKVNYRRFTIRDVEGQNDFAMLAEAVTRRLTRLREEQRPFPDLLLIDGGAGQLSAVQGILSDFDNPPMIISLAKQEELLFSPWTDAPVKLPGTDPGLRLMQRIRDEVHRYALTSHKKARGKQFKHSLIENIEGVGPRRAEMLLKQFGSITGIAKASIEDISRIKGITEECAKRIIEAARVYVLKK